MSRGLLVVSAGALALTMLVSVGPATAGVEVNEDVLLGIGSGQVPASGGAQGLTGSVYGGSVSRTRLPYNRPDNQERYTVPSATPVRPYSGPRRGGIKLRRPGTGPKQAAPIVMKPPRSVGKSTAEPVAPPARQAVRQNVEINPGPAVVAAPVAPVTRHQAPEEPAKAGGGTRPGADTPPTAPASVGNRPVKPRDIAPEPPRNVTPEPANVAAVKPDAPTKTPATTLATTATQKPAPVVISPELTRIVFEETSSELPDGYQDVIAAMASNIKDGSTVRVQIHSYAFAENETLLWARRMAQRRAIIVRKVLRDEGITANRIAVRTDIDPDDDGPRNRVDLTILPPR